MKLQYCDLQSATLSVEDLFKRKDLVEICYSLSSRINSIDLTSQEKRRLVVLGILLSTSREEQTYFLEKLRSVDPQNGLVTAVMLKDSILYDSASQTEGIIEKFLTEEKIDFYIQQGYRNHYKIWTSFFGENLTSFSSLQRKQHNSLISRRIQEFASVFWMYDILNKYQKTHLTKGLPLVDYFSLDQLFLSKLKMSYDDFGWHADITNIQLKFFYRNYYDSTLYYATGIDSPRPRAFGEVREIEDAKQTWINNRNQLQEILFEQRKEIYELVKCNMLAMQKLESTSSSSSNNYSEYLKFHILGQETAILNNLKRFDADQMDGLVKNRLMPLIEKEKQFWQSKLLEEPKER